MHPGGDERPIRAEGSEGAPVAPYLYAYRSLLFQRDAQQRALGSLGSLVAHFKADVSEDKSTYEFNSHYVQKIALTRIRTIHTPYSKNSNNTNLTNHSHGGQQPSSVPILTSPVRIPDGYLFLIKRQA